MRRDLHWSKIFGKAVSLFRAGNGALFGFAAGFAVLSYLQGFDVSILQNPENLDPLKIWLQMVRSLLLVAVSFLVWVVLVLWIRDRKKGETQVPLSSLVKKGFQLQVPLMILGIRGALVFVVGFLCFILPGFYYIFKYQLASMSLVLEDWKEEGPIKAAGDLIQAYRWKLIPFVVLFYLPPLLVLSLQLTASWLQVDQWLTVKTSLACLDGGLSTFSTVVTTYAFLAMTARE